MKTIMSSIIFANITSASINYSITIVFVATKYSDAAIQPKAYHSAENIMKMLAFI